MIDSLLKNLLPTDKLQAVGNFSTCYYCFHGLPVSVTANSPAISAAVDELLAFFCTSLKPGSEDEILSFYMLQNSTTIMELYPEIGQKGELIFDSLYDAERDTGIDFKYYAWGRYQVADYGPLGGFIVDVPKACMVGLFPDPSLIHPQIISSNIFITAFTEILRARDFFLVHSGAVATEGRGFLLPGYSGSGKTTLSLALVRSGFKFLADDRPVLRKDDAGFSLLAFPEAVNVTDKTIAFIPELKVLSESFFCQGRRKKSVLIEDVYPRAIIERCHVEAILFPKITVAEESRLLPLTKIEAISRILPHSLLILNREFASRQFEHLCDLVDNCSCYELQTGRDMLDCGHLLERIV
jgi:hypothetical protein